jgi:MtN3 and saliva related transmembrane protein
VDLSSSSLVALTAGTLTTIAFVPQVVRAWRTQSVDDLSLGMLLTFNAGVALWITYGVMVREPPMILTNGVTLFLALMLLGMKLRWR